MTQPFRVGSISGIICPRCAIGYYQLAKAADETGIGIEVHWHPFELHPQRAAEGENLREHLAAEYGTTLEGSKKARARLTDVGTALGFTFNCADDMRMVNTFRAHQRIDWAENQGMAYEAKLALFEAFFTRRENLNSPSVLDDVAQSIGLNVDTALEMLASGKKADNVRQKEQFWTSHGLTAAPAIIFQHQYPVSGARGEKTTLETCSISRRMRLLRSAMHTRPGEERR